MKQKNKFFYFIFIVLFIITVLLILFYPILFGKKIFSSGDTLFYSYPAFYFFKQSIDQLTNLNFWSAEILAGFPVYVSLTGGFFYFLNLVFFKLFHFITVYHWITFLNFFLGALFSYLFIRNLNLGRIASLIGSLAYILSYFTISYGDVTVLSNFYFILPLLFLSLLKISQGKYRYILLGGFGLGIGWLAGHPQLILFVVLASLFYALFLDYLNRQSQKSLFQKLIVSQAFMVICLISLLIGFIQLLPSADFSHLSARSLGLTYQEAVVGALSPVDLISYFFPYFKLPHFNWGDQGMLYFGFLPLFFALLAVFNHQRNKNILFFIFLYGFSFLSAIPYSPIFWLFHQLPGFAYFRVPLRWMYLGAFASAILAAYGYQFFLINAGQSRKIINIFKYLIYTIISLVVIGNILFWTIGRKIITFLQDYFDNYLYQKTIQLPLTHYHRLIESYSLEFFDNINLANYRFLIPFAFILLGYYLIKIYSQNKINLAKFKFLVVLIIAANFLLVYQGQAQFISRQLYLRTPQTVEFIRSQESNPDGFRIFSFMPGFSEYQKLVIPYNPQLEDLFIFQSEMLVPNLNILYGLQSIDGYDNIMPRRNARILAELGSDRATMGNKLTERKISLEEKIEAFLSRVNLLTMGNVKYIISTYHLPTDKLNLVKEIKVTQYKIPIYIYQNPQVLPRVYFAQEIQFIGLDEIENFDLLLNPEIDFHQTTFIECTDCQSTASNGFSEIAIEEYRNGLLRLESATDRSQWLIFSESNLPNWQATIDGKLTDIYTANYLFQAIKVPTGKHLIEFIYQGVTKYEGFLFN